MSISSNATGGVSTVQQACLIWHGVWWVGRKIANSCDEMKAKYSTVRGQSSLVLSHRTVKRTKCDSRQRSSAVPSTEDIPIIAESGKFARKTVDGKRASSQKPDSPSTSTEELDCRPRLEAKDSKHHTNQPNAKTFKGLLPKASSSGRPIAPWRNETVGVESRARLYHCR